MDCQQSGKGLGLSKSYVGHLNACDIFKFYKRLTHLLPQCIPTETL